LAINRDEKTATVKQHLDNEGKNRGESLKTLLHPMQSHEKQLMKSPCQTFKIQTHRHQRTEPK